MSEMIGKQSKRFYEILDTIKELHDKKRHDYGADEDIFANFRLSEQCGISAWKGSVVRMGDKYARISNYIKKGEFKFKEESIKDTLMDMAIYSLITMILFEEEEFDQSIKDDINRECDIPDVPPIIGDPEGLGRTPVDGSLFDSPNLGDSVSRADDYKVTYTSRATPSYATKMKSQQVE